jgi:hypothetical protein
VTYILPADLREVTVKSYAAGLILGPEVTDAYLTTVIAAVAARVELDLADDFDPPSPDNDEIITITGNGLTTTYLPRRTRSLTTVKTTDLLGTQTTQASGSYRLLSSLNATGTAMVDQRKLDALQLLSGSTLYCWPSEPGSIELTGKFGWAAVPEDIKRLVALLVYDQVKATADPLHTIVTKNTIDAQFTYGPSAEVTDIMDRYRRLAVMSA